MELGQLIDKKFALVVVGEDEKGKDEVAVFRGLAKVENGHLYFHRNDEGVHFEVPIEAIGRIKPVPLEIADILLNCDFYVTLSIGPVPANDNLNEYVRTGLKWPE